MSLLHNLFHPEAWRLLQYGRCRVGKPVHGSIQFIWSHFLENVHCFSKFMQTFISAAFFFYYSFSFMVSFRVSFSLLDLFFCRKTCHPSLWISLSWHCWSSYTAYGFREHIMDSFVLPFPSKCTCLGYIFFSYLCSATTATKLHFRVKMWPV